MARRDNADSWFLSRPPKFDSLGLMGRQLEVGDAVSDGAHLLDAKEADPATDEGGHALRQTEELQATYHGQGQAAANGPLDQHLPTGATAVGDTEDCHRA